MPDLAGASDKQQATREWLIGLDPRFRDLLDSHPQGSAAPEPSRSEAGAAPGGAGPVKAGYEIELKSTEIGVRTKYGELKISLLAKASPTVIGAGKSQEPVGSATTITSKDKKGRREGGIKQSFSYKDLGSLEPFSGVQVKDISIGLEAAFSGAEVAVSAVIAFVITTAAFKALGSGKLVLFKAKEGEGVKVLGGEVKVSPQKFTLPVGSFEVAVQAEFKASFFVDMKKVGAEVGKDVLKKLAKDALEKQAAKAGVKAATREVAQAVLKDLGPVMFAFGVGLDIGEVLNTFTVAPQVAGYVMEDILGDLNERYQRASTFGKVVLVTGNSHRIIGALIAAGVTGAAAGIGDLVLCKLLHLDELPSFQEAYALFQSVAAAIPNFGQGFADQVASGAVILGIKLNPKHHKIKEPAFGALAAAAYSAVKPLFKAQGGLNKLLGTSVQDIDVDERTMTAAIDVALKRQFAFFGGLDLTGARTAMDSFMALSVSAFVVLMEANGLISYDVSFGNLDASTLDEALLKELFG